jgi:hypothetical protein
MVKLKPAVCIATTLFIAACASNYDLRKGERSPWGAGIAVRPVKSGLFAINVQMTAMPVSNTAGAVKQWRELALKACGGRSFEEASIQIGSTDFTQPFLGVIPYKVATQYGYAICEDAQLTTEETTALRNGNYSE